MAKNNNKKWTRAEEKKVESLAKKGTPTPKIAKILQRTESAIRSKASKKKISLKPKDE